MRVPLRQRVASSTGTSMALSESTVCAWRTEPVGSSPSKSAPYASRMASPSRSPLYESAAIWLVASSVPIIVGLALVDHSHVKNRASLWTSRSFEVGVVILSGGALMFVWGIILFIAHRQAQRLAGATSGQEREAEHPEAFSTETHPKSDGRVGSGSNWNDLNQYRELRYSSNRGLFLVHTWSPSKVAGQVADVVVHLIQHRDGPLTFGKVAAVEYTFGPKFDDHSVTKSISTANGFAMETSMWGPMLCVAKVSFNDGTDPLLLERYIDFD